MTADLQAKEYERAGVLYMAMELSDKTWRLAFGDGKRSRQVCIDAGDMAVLGEQVVKAKAKLGLESEAAVVSCYEAGRDGFWVHRQLEALGIENHVVDAASIEVSRRARRAKTDRLDARALLEKLVRYAQGERVCGGWCGCRRRSGKTCASCTVSASSCAASALVTAIV
jgi:transposase